MEETQSKPKRRFFRSPWMISLLIFLAIVMVIAYSNVREKEAPPAPKPKQVNVEVQTIKAREFSESLALPAIITADRVASIKPEVAGILERWLFPEGSEVELGDVIAELDTKPLRLNLEELEAALKTASQNVVLSTITKEKAEVNLANMQKATQIQEVALESAEATLVLAKKQYDRTQRMAAQKIATTAQLDDSENALIQAKLGVSSARQNVNSALLNIEVALLAIKEAEAGIELAEARIVELEASIERLNYQIEKGQLKAPFSGKLEARLVEAGEMVSPGVSIVNVYDLKYLRAVVDVPDRYIAFLDPENGETKNFIRLYHPTAQQKVSAKIIIPGLPKLTGGTESDVEFDANIARIAQSANPESNTFKVELRFRNPGNALKHGQIARGKIEYLYYPKAILIPIKAIQVTDLGPRVMVVEGGKGQETAAIRDIEPASIQGSKAFIQSGLNEGERLILAGWKGLVGGEKVHILVDDGVFQKPE